MMDMPEGCKGPVVAIANLETRLRVGIWDHERDFQPVQVDMVIATGASPLQHGGVCIDYRPIVQWIRKDWPRTPHLPLLETRLLELMAFVFGFEPAIEWLDAALSKPQAFPQAQGVGVRMALSRSEHAMLYPPARR